MLMVLYPCILVGGEHRQCQVHKTWNLQFGLISGMKCKKNQKITSNELIIDEINVWRFAPSNELMTELYFVHQVR